MKRTIRGLRWWIIAVVMIGTSLNYLTRSTLGVAAPDAWPARRSPPG